MKMKTQYISINVDNFASEDFNFATDIDWAGLAAQMGRKLVPDVSIGYDGDWDNNAYAARLVGGGVLVVEIAPTGEATAFVDADTGRFAYP